MTVDSAEEGGHPDATAHVGSDANHGGRGRQHAALAARGAADGAAAVVRVQGPPVNLKRNILTFYRKFGFGFYCMQVVKGAVKVLVVRHPTSKKNNLGFFHLILLMQKRLAKLH